MRRRIALNVSVFPQNPRKALSCRSVLCSPSTARIVCSFHGECTNQADEAASTGTADADPLYSVASEVSRLLNIVPHTKSCTPPLETKHVGSGPHSIRLQLCAPSRHHKVASVVGVVSIRLLHSFASVRKLSSWQPSHMPLNQQLVLSDK